MNRDWLAPFSGFDPRKPPPPTLFIDFAPLHQRAFPLVRGFGHRQLFDMANIATWMIEEYFRQHMAKAVERYTAPGSKLWKYLPKGAPRTEQSIKDLFHAGLPLDAQREVSDFPNRTNTNQVDALKACITQYDFANEEVLKGTEPYHFFAVLGLQLIGFGIQFCDAPTDLHGTPLHARPSSNTRRSLSFAHDASIEALDAICYAEHLRATEMLRREIAHTGEGFRAFITSQKPLLATIQTLSNQGAKLEAEIKEARNADEQITTNKLSQHFSKIAKKGHAADSLMEDTVRKIFLRIRADFMTSDAGVVFDEIEKELNGMNERHPKEQWIKVPAVRTGKEYVRKFRRELGDPQSRGRPRKKRLRKKR